MIAGKRGDQRQKKREREREREGAGLPLGFLQAAQI